MPENCVKVMTLNIANYHTFDKRRNRIISLIRRCNPDILALQEVRDDKFFNKEGINQAIQLNSELNFKFLHYIKTTNMKRAENRTTSPDCFEGMALLSRYPVTNIIEQKLKKQDTDKYERSVLLCDLDLSEGKHISLLLVHFSPNDLFAHLHLVETLHFVEKQKIKPIIIGDFNIKSTEEISKLIGQTYLISSKIFQYVSFPSENQTFDYILIPKQFKFKSFECMGETVSDHRALVANILI